MNVFFSLLNFCVWAINTQHQEKYFYLYFKCQSQRNRSALVIWNIIERELCQRDLVKGDRAFEHVLVDSNKA